MDEFRWDEDPLAFASVRGVAVYESENGECVIRQQAGALDNDDSFIVVPFDRIDALIAALKKVGHGDA